MLDRLIAGFVFAAWDDWAGKQRPLPDTRPLWALYYWSLGRDDHAERHRRDYEGR